MSRRLDLQIAALKILDTLIDAGIVPCHEETTDPGLNSMLQAARDYNVRPVPNIVAEFREWQKNALDRIDHTIAERDTPAAQREWDRTVALWHEGPPPRYVTMSEIQAERRAWRNDAPSQVDMDPEITMPKYTTLGEMAPAIAKVMSATPETIPFKDNEASAAWDAIEDELGEKQFADYIETETAAEAAATPPAEHLDTPATTEDGEPAPVCDVPVQPVLMTTKELSKLLGRSSSSLATDATAGEIPPPFKLGGKRYWRRAEIDTWVAAGCPRWAAATQSAPVIAQPVDPAQPEDMYGTDAA